MKTSNNLSISHFLKIKFSKTPSHSHMDYPTYIQKRSDGATILFFKTEKSIKSPPNTPSHTHTFEGGENSIKSNPQLLDFKLKSEINTFCVSNEKFYKIILVNYPKSSN